MVSAAKLRRAQENIYALRPYAQELNNVIASVARASGGELSHPLLQSKHESERNSVLVVVITSERACVVALTPASSRRLNAT